MSQFDVYKDKVGSRYPLLLDVQADLLGHLSTRVVVPLATKQRYPATPIRRLNPILLVRGVEYVAVFQELAAIAATELGSLVAACHDRRADLLAALDLVFTGS